MRVGDVLGVTVPFTTRGSQPVPHSFRSGTCRPLAPRPVRRFERRSILAPWTLVVLLSLSCGPAGDGSSQGAGGPLGEPTVVFPDDFGAIQTVRELDDHTVLVADPLGGALYRVDLDAGTRAPIGSEGQGPAEYRQPDAVWPLPGDSTLLIDLGNGRMTALGPDLTFGPTSPLSSGDPRSGLVVAIPQGIDALGRVYAQSIGGGMGSPPDSGAVLRVERGSLAIDTVAMYKVSDVVRTESGGVGERSVSIQQVPLSPEDAWGVAPDGSVVIARSGDYHVEWHASDGGVTAGDPVPYEPVSIGTAEKERWVRGQGRGGGGIGIRVEMSDGGAIQTSFGRGGGGSGQREIDQYQWPETEPPFYDGRIVVDRLGRAWVRRHVEPDEDATYDLFDRSGDRVATFTLTGDRDVVGFGEDAVYVVSYDDFDLSYLERYALP